MSVWDDLVKMGDDLAKAGSDLLSGNANAAANDLGAAATDAGNAAKDTPGLLKVLPNEIAASLVDAGYGFRDIFGNFFASRGPEGPLHPIDDKASGATGLPHLDVSAAVANLEKLVQGGTNGSEDDNGKQGWRPGWSWGHNPDLSATRLTEDNPAVKAGEELKDAYLRAHPPHLGEPINPHEKVPGPDLGQGLGHSSTGGGSSFADLIRVAQNPKEFGLATGTHPTASDTALHLAVNADLSGHGFGPSGVEDLHVATGVTSVTVHDIHVDQHAITTPVLDQIHVVHH
jgi:hypothetical protein